MTTTPHLHEAVCSVENAETFLDAADHADELPSAVVGLCTLQLRNVRRLLEFHAS